MISRVDGRTLSFNQSCPLALPSQSYDGAPHLGAQLRHAALSECAQEPMFIPAMLRDESHICRALGR